MTKKRRGFTLIELLVVIAIIAILSAILAPVFVSAKKAINNSTASRTAKQLFTATTLYQMDYDDTFPLAMYDQGNGFWQTWFGSQTAVGEFDRQRGIISPYVRGFLQADPSHRGLPYLGDGTGFGYNYGYLGSDFTISGDYSHWPNCYNAAISSSISYPSKAIVFASSAFYSAKWLPKGDGKTYDFGFIDAPSGWNGNPNVDFRHWDKRVIDSSKKEVRTTGRAVCVFADGHTSSLHQDDMKDDNFERNPSDFDSR